MFEDVGFHDFKISVKHHDVITMVETYRLLASKGDWPLHLGVTEAGPAWQGTIKSCLAFGALLAEGIGDTIRVSLSAPPVEEVKVGCKLLEYMGLRPRNQRFRRRTAIFRIQFLIERARVHADAQRNARISGGLADGGTNLIEFANVARIHAHRGTARINSLKHVFALKMNIGDYRNR